MRIMLLGAILNDHHQHSNAHKHVNCKHALLKNELLHDSMDDMYASR